MQHPHSQIPSIVPACLWAAGTAVLTLWVGIPIATAAPTAVPLDHKQATQFLDIRGVGDAGMALTNKQPLPLTQPLPGDNVAANFGARLDALDRTGKSYRGDLSFINWETAVGKRCNRFWAPPTRSTYSFMSHPDNLKARSNVDLTLLVWQTITVWTARLAKADKKAPSSPPATWISLHAVYLSHFCGLAWPSTIARKNKRKSKP